MLHRLVAVLGCLCLVFSNAGTVHAIVSYNVTDLGTLGEGLSTSYARGINNSGQIVGAYGSQVAPTFYDYRAFLYSGNGPMQDIGSLPDRPSTWAYSINNIGQIVGYSANAAYARAFFYDNGTMTDLGTLSGEIGTTSRAFGINDVGQVVGESIDGYRHAFLYSGSGPLQDLGTLGGSESSACAINNNGLIVGWAKTDSNEPRAFFCSGNGTLQDLGTLGGWGSWAKAVNDAGEVVGSTYTATGYEHAFLYSGNGPMLDVSAASGMEAVHSRANDINNKGQIVGEAGGYAFVYSGGLITDLNSLTDPSSEWLLTEAYAINDHGQIVCDALSRLSSTQHAILLTPVPEPSTFALLLAAAIGSLLWWRRPS
jgi:probable HAF family extracellular repeat protein